MLKQEPELESLLEVPLPTAGTRSTAVDPEIYRRQAAAVFSRGWEDWNRGWESPGDVAEELLAILSIGEGFARQGDYVNAAAVYEGVLLESLKHFEEYHEESGAMSEVISEGVDGLGVCLENERDPAMRESIVRTLFEVYRFDIDFGGVGLSDEVPEILFEHATPEERGTVAGWVREAMPAAGGSTSSWKREAYGGFLLDLEEESLDDEVFLQVCRESGRVHDLVDRLLSLERIQEAVQGAKRASDYELLHLAAIFDRHERGDLADQLMVERSQTTQDTRILDWLKDRCKFQGNLAASLSLAEKVFRMRPDLARYRELRDLGRKTGDWDALRPRILTFLGEQGWNDLLIAIRLEEGEVDEALKALRTAKSPVIGYSYGLYGDEPLALRVARAATETRPRDALEIYGQQVERLIAGRNRGNYTEAARLLVRMRDIYITLGESADWSRYLEELRGRYRSLRALKEEMAAVGL